MKQLFGFKGFFAYIAMVFINAFVDLGHKIIVQNTVFKIYDGDIQVILTAVLNALILLPFIFLFSPSGFIADKHPKPKVMRISAIVAICATVLITLCYYQGWFLAAFALTLVMGIQSAIYSPAKYGYLKELIGVENLAQGNAMVQAVTIVSILSGTFVFSALFEMLLVDVSLDSPSVIMQSIVVIGWIFVALSLIEWYFACQLKNTKERDDSMVFTVKEFVKGSYLSTNLKIIFSNKVIWLSIIGLSMFWSVSQVMLATFPAFAKEVLLENNTIIIQGILGCTGIGIVIGSLLAAKVSRNHIELGLVPISALIFAILIGGVAELESRITMAFAFLSLGISGGLFIIPLNSLIQYHAKESELGTVLAGNNWVQNVAMLTALIATIALVSIGFTSINIFYLLMFVAFAGAIYTIAKLPHSLIRVSATFIMRRRYKLDILGFENLPAEGGLLLLGNHISWIDGILVQMACPRRVRFVMLRRIYELWYLKPIMQFFGCIPISAGNSKESLALVNQALKNGDVVCLFPEGAISRTGSLGVFRTGYERVVDGVDGIILPFYLHGLWGSRLSRAKSEKLRQNTRKSFRRDVSITFGKPLAMQTPARQLKQKVFELSLEAWEHHVNKASPLPLAWIESAMQNNQAIAVKDSIGKGFSHRKLVAETTAVASKIRAIDNSQNIGLLLPASSGAVIANLAVLLNGQTTVNINHTLEIPAIQTGIKSAAVKTIISSEIFLQQLSASGVDTEAMLDGITVLMIENLQSQQSKLIKGLAYLATYLLNAKLYYRAFGKKTDLNAPAAILFSNGNASVSKGVVLSHKNFIANIRQISDLLITRENDVVLGSLPPHQSLGLTVTTLLPLIEGIKLVCHPDPSDVLNISKTIVKSQATILCTAAEFVPLYSQNKKVQPLMLESLRGVISGAGILSQEVRQEFKNKFNKDVYEGYGSNETTPVASVNIPDQLDPNDFSLQTGAKKGSVGMPVPGCSFRIVDPETCEQVDAEQSGLILISGSQVMLGYLNDEVKTKEAIIELDNRRWFKTGDIGYVDKDGFLTVVDGYS